MIQRDAAIGLLPIILGLGCVQDLDPCPTGSSLTGDRCARQHPAVRADAGQKFDGGRSPDAGSEPDDADTAQNDAGDVETDADPEADAALDADEPDGDDSGELDAHSDADPPPPTDAAADATADAAPDAGLDGGDAGSSICAPEDLARWQDFHLSAQLIAHIGSCWQDSRGCSIESCPIKQCLMRGVGMASCDACIVQEAACVAAACAEPCGASIDNEACRACACRHECVVAFEACSGRVLDVCDDCNDTTCTNVTLAPALIMTLVNPLLL